MIVVPALHPAHEIIARVRRLEPGEVHRASQVATTVGGKPVNVARLAALMGAPVRLIVLGDDRLLARLAADPALARSAAAQVRLHAPDESRTDIAMVDDRGGLTVVNGMAGDPGERATRNLISATLDGLARGDVLVLAGSTPPGTMQVYAELGPAAHARGARVLVDAAGPWLASTLDLPPDAVKISASEAAALTAAATGPDEDRPVDPGSARPTALSGPRILGITDGPRGLLAWLPDGGCRRIEPPPGLSVVNPLGAGDAVTAGLAISMDRGMDPLDGFVLGTAMAAARLRHLEVTLMSTEVEALRSRVMVSPVA